MRRLTCAGLILGALAGLPVPAHANHYLGGCSLVSINDPSGNILHPTDQAGAIVAAIVNGYHAECWIDVNGSESRGTRAVFDATDGVIVGAHTTSYPTGVGILTRVCEQVDSDAVFCHQGHELKFPDPQGCYGAATAVVCNIRAEVTLPYTVEYDEMIVPVCVGTCVEVPVTIVKIVSQRNPGVCVSYENRDGTPAGRTCVR